MASAAPQNALLTQAEPDHSEVPASASAAAAAAAPAAAAAAAAAPNDPLLDARPAAAAHEDSTAVYKIVLTGGPCAGKTTAASRLSDIFRAKG
ncbi:unnamed protein product [Ectocarpus sp. 12 AP-2014]